MSNRQWVIPNQADRIQGKPEMTPAACFAAGERNHHIANTAYPIAHQSTWKPYRVSRDQHPSLVRQAFADIDDLCLYAHIPFCEVRCSFCEYTVVGKKQLGNTQEYMQALQQELKLYSQLLDTPNRTLHGFDIGGGTPAFVDSKHIADLVEEVHRCFKVSDRWGISIETTPRLAAAQPQKLKDYLACGIDRISMGIQVIQPDLLKMLNRDGNGVEHHFRAVENIRGAGFGKFNIDLMYGFAKQSLVSWEATLRHAIALDPEYITLYRMRYKLTRISHEAHLVAITNVRAQAKLAKEILASAGFLANPGKNTYSRVPNDNGTSAYITRRVVDGMPYLGLGLGAQTFTHRTISYNDGAVGKDLTPYLKSVEQGRLPIQDLYDLPLGHMMAKMICVSLYFGEINRVAFREKFGLSIEQAYPNEIEFLLGQGLMEWTAEALSMTELGAQHFSGVVSQFHAPSIKSYLLQRDPNAAEDMIQHRSLANKVATRSVKVAVESA
jgi:oxygen-independent coproporphyrinogen III oxidase